MYVTKLYRIAEKPLRKPMTLQIKYLAPQPNMLLSFQEMYPDLCSHDSLTTLILLQLNEKAYLWIIQNSDNFRPHSSYMIVKNHLEMMMKIRLTIYFSNVFKKLIFT